MSENHQTIANWIEGKESATQGDHLEKYDPHTGALQSLIYNSTKQDVDHAISVAVRAFPGWAATTPVERGQILFEIAAEMKVRVDELSECVARETGKPPQDAEGEVRAAIAQAEYFAGEGSRLFGRTLTSSMSGKRVQSVREPRGVAALIVPANTPIANIAWKTFPALICGNSTILKASEDAPSLGSLMGSLFQKAGLPDGVFNVIHGQGDRAGRELVVDDRVAVISFTGSTSVGREIAEVAGRRLARISLELGGKNPFLVCDDADIDNAVHWASLSAFSNAGQRCASASRFTVFDSVYEEFVEKLVKKAQSLVLGTHRGADLGPVINKRQQERILGLLEQAENAGAVVLCGGSDTSAMSDLSGYYVQPTLIEGLTRESTINSTELFGPVATIHAVRSFDEAMMAVNDSDYGLTAAIHTQNIDRAMAFCHGVRAGVANVNFGTYGSEPHMPFGGVGGSGNGTREPGLEALDVYSELKNISILVRDSL